MVSRSGGAASRCLHAQQGAGRSPLQIRREIGMNEKDVSAAAAISADGHISRRDGLKLVAAGMAAALLSHASRIEALSGSLQSTQSERKREPMSSYIKVGRKTQRPLNSTTRTMAPDRR